MTYTRPLLGLAGALALCRALLNALANDPTGFIAVVAAVGCLPAAGLVAAVRAAVGVAETATGLFSAAAMSTAWPGDGGLGGGGALPGVAAGASVVAGLTVEATLLALRCGEGAAGWTGLAFGTLRGAVQSVFGGGSAKRSDPSELPAGFKPQTASVDAGGGWRSSDARFLWLRRADAWASCGSCRCRSPA